MNTEQTAQQLELAAKILRTGHPWECKFSANVFEKPVVSLITAISNEKEIRPILATPPDNRPLHNPENLTAEQVGVGYRLLCAEDGVPSGKVDTWMFGGWCSAYVVDKEHLYECDKTYRLPLSVPWPEAKPDPYAALKKAHAEGKVIQWHDGIEWIDHILPHYNNPIWMHPVKDYRIKPETTFQLPPPPLGMQWHREDGWKEGDLPQGMRPLVAGEKRQSGDEYRYRTDPSWGMCQLRIAPNPNSNEFYRTRRPLTFTHAGKTWTWHRPGDPMPCDGEACIEIISLLGKTTSDDGTLPLYPRAARSNIWEQTLGWRYADEKKTVPLEDETIADLSDDEIIKIRRLLKWFDKAFLAVDA